MNFLVCAYKSQDFAQTQHSLRSHTTVRRLHLETLYRSNSLRPWFAHHWDGRKQLEPGTLDISVHNCTELHFTVSYSTLLYS